MVPVVAQVCLSLLAVTSGAIQKFSANVDRAMLVPFTLGQFESSSGAESSLTPQSTLVLLTCKEGEEGEWETPTA